MSNLNLGTLAFKPSKEAIKKENNVINNLLRVTGLTNSDNKSDLLSKFEDYSKQQRIIEELKRP